MKIIIIFLINIVIIYNTIYAQSLEDDYSLTRVKKIEGVYIFIGSDPAQKYDYLGTVKAIMTWNGTPSEAFAKAVRKAKNKYPNLQGLIFADDDFDKADAISFPGLELTGGGYRISDKVLYKYGSTIYYGEIISLDNSNKSAKFRYINKYGEDKIENTGYNNLSKINDEDYYNKIAELKEIIALHAFIIGEYVKWTENNEIQLGKVVKLDVTNHKVIIEYLNIFNEYKTKPIPNFDLTKINESEYLNFLSNFKEKIKKYQFKIGEQVSFVINYGLLIDDIKEYKGHIIELDAVKHLASIKFIDSTGKEKISKIDYLKIIKIQ